MGRIVHDHGNDVCFYSAKIEREPSYLAHSDLRWVKFEDLPNYELASAEQKFFSAHNLDYESLLVDE